MKSSESLDPKENQAPRDDALQQILAVEDEAREILTQAQDQVKQIQKEAEAQARELQAEALQAAEKHAAETIAAARRKIESATQGLEAQADKQMDTWEQSARERVDRAANWVWRLIARES